jgi:hypothetical protein
MAGQKKPWIWFIGLYAAGLLTVFLLAGLVKLIIYFFG